MPPLMSVQKLDFDEAARVRAQIRHIPKSKLELRKMPAGVFYSLMSLRMSAVSRIAGTGARAGDIP